MLHFRWQHIQEGKNSRQGFKLLGTSQPQARTEKNDDPHAVCLLASCSASFLYSDTVQGLA